MLKYIWFAFCMTIAIVVSRFGGIWAFLSWGGGTMLLFISNQLLPVADKRLPIPILIIVSLIAGSTVGLIGWLFAQ